MSDAAAVIVCACEQARRELASGNRARARFDAVRALHALLEPFSPPDRDLIKRAYDELAGPHEGDEGDDDDAFLEGDDDD